MDRKAVLRAIRAHLPAIGPSMLKCDFGNLRGEIERLEAAGAPLLHLDVMDAQFVPNLSYGPMVIEKIRPLTQLPFDAHLMIADPARYLDDYLDAGCDLVTVHIEAVQDPSSVLGRIRDAGAGSGLAINPETPVERVLPWLDRCDLVLVMSVKPGFGGQKFIPSVLPKLLQIRAASPDVLLSIDGGIGPETIRDAASSGAEILVAGSAIFDTSDYSSAISRLTRLAADAVQAV